MVAARIAIPLFVLLAGLFQTAASADVSYTAERELGKRFDMMAHERFPLVRDPEFVSYVSGIGQEIVSRLDDSFFEYRFAVVNDGSINAFAVPGGYIYVNVGLLNHAKNDDEVAAVLGHEVAHIHAHHMARQQEKTQLISYASLLGMLATVVNPALGSLAMAAGQAAELKYRREFEQEADYLGVRYLRGTGYDPRAMLDFFKKLQDESRLIPTFLPPYLSSHPLTDERLNHLEAVLRAKQWEGHERKNAGARLQRLKALARARGDKPKDVLEQYEKLRRENEGNPNADYLYGVVALEIGRFDEARAALESARKGGVVAADRELGRVALRKRETETSIRLLRTHLEREPRDGLAWVELAKALDASGDTEGAQSAYRSGFDVVPELDSAHEGFGRLVGRGGDQGAGFYHLGLASRMRGDYKKALELLNRAVPLLDEKDERTTRAQQEITDLEKYLEVQSKGKK